MKFIIFFCCYVGYATQIDGEIVIRYDNKDSEYATVDAFGLKWITLPESEIISDGVRVIRAKIPMYTIHNSDTVKAFIHVNYKDVVFTIPNVEVATMRQLPHQDMEYPDDF